MSKNSLPKAENPQAQRLFIFLSFAMIFITGIGAAGALLWFLTPDIPFEFDPVVGILFIMIFLGYVIGIIGIFKPQPPLHYGIIIASAINLVISLIIVFGAGNSRGILQGAISFLILYLGLRFPLKFGEGEVTFNID